MLKNMKIKKSLLLGFGIVIVVSVAIILISLASMLNMEKKYASILSSEVAANQEITTARMNANIAAKNLREILLHPTDTETNTTAKARIVELMEELDGNEATLEATWPTELDKALVDEYNTMLNNWEVIADEVMELFEQYEVTGAEETLQAAIAKVNDECSPALKALSSVASEIDNLLSETQEAEVTTLNRTNTLTIVILLAATAIATIFVIALALAIIRCITVPTRQVQEALVGFSQGKFDIPVEFNGKNELGNMAEALRYSQEGLRSIVEEVSYVLGEMAKGNFALRFKDESIYRGEMIPMREAIRDINHRLSDTLAQITMSAEQVSAGAEQVSTGAQALAQGATEQASAVEELSATVTEISNNAQSNAKGSEDAMEKTNYASSQLDESAKNMDEMIVAMKKISEASQEIGKIIDTIENIAFQTNILALNAAVEAARAGSAGKGFAVVADEVRNLATKSDEAAKATKELIDNSLASVRDGNQIVERVSDSLQKTVDATDELKNSISSIAKAVEEEAEAIAQVTEGIDQISSVVQTNSATSEESAAASEELSSQAVLIKELMNKFKLRSSEDNFADVAAAVPTAFQAADYSVDDVDASRNFAKY